MTPGGWFGALRRLWGNGRWTIRPLPPTQWAVVIEFARVGEAREVVRRRVARLTGRDIVWESEGVWRPVTPPATALRWANVRLMLGNALLAETTLTPEQWGEMQRLGVLPALRDGLQDLSVEALFRRRA